MKIIIVNGPNLNLLGKRERNIYGNISFDEYYIHLQEKYKEVELEYFQSNHEGEIIDLLHDRGFKKEVTGIVMNGGAYTHTSIAIADAIAAIETPVVEVHISNIYARESFRQHSYTATNCIGCITGLGLRGYSLAIQYLIEEGKMDC